MSKRPRSKATLAVYGVSIVLHAGLAVGAILAPKTKKSEVVAISMAEAKKAPARKDDTPPPPPPPPPPAAKARAPRAPLETPAPKPAATPVAPDPAPAANDAPESFADLGLTIGNGGGGLAVPTGPHATAPAPARETQRKVKTLAPVREDACDEPIVKAKLRGSAVKPAYTDDARRAQIEGVVRVEITVDEQGNVIAVKVLKGLGYGLDEAAIAAAKQMAFEPGTRCGRIAVTKLTAGMRFALQQ